MVDNAVLRERIRAELDSLGLTETQADQVVQEVNVLACLLIDAVLEEVPRDKAN